MGVSFDLKLLPIDDPKLVEMFKGLGFYEATIPAATYPFVMEDIATVAHTEFLSVRPDLSEDIVYYTIKALLNQKDLLIATHAEFERQLTPSTIATSLARAEQFGLTTHPGALKLYREIGWIE
jgi:TRAP-type uncharacterized transport system substrate-binding protein